MKRILKLPTLLLVAMSAMFLYSCSDDPVDPPVNTPPAVTLTSASDLTVEPEEEFTIAFSASIGSDSPLKAVTVYEDGTKVPVSRMKVNGVDAAANAILITGTDVDGLSWTIDIIAQSSAGTTVAFEVEVQDEAGGRNSIFVNVTTAGTPPTLTGAEPLDFEILVGSINQFRLTGEKGTGDLASLEVRENGSAIDPSRLSWDGESMVGMDNPFLLGETEKGGFEETRLGIDLPMIVGEYEYIMILTDEFGLKDSVVYNVTAIGTAIEMRMGVLLNAGGGQGTGGLDLDNGNSTNSDDAEAEIKDNGIDLDLPPEDNWLRTISPIVENGVAMKYLTAGEAGLPETFLFSDVAYKEDLPGFFDSGVELIDGATDIVQPGDVFIVERDGNYWMLEVISVTTDPNNNSDQYEFDIKY